MLNRILAAAALGLLLASCIPASNTMLGTWGHPTREAAERSGAVITQTEVSTLAGDAASCSAAPVGACGGCTVTCPAGKPAQCSTGTPRAVDVGQPAACRREASCGCG